MPTQNPTHQPNRNRFLTRRRAALPAAVIALCALSATSGAAYATGSSTTEASGERPRGATVGALAATSPDLAMLRQGGAVDAVAAYWTPERMRRAITVPKPRGNSIAASPSASTPPRPTAPVRYSKAQQANQPQATRASSAKLTSGKVFFTNPNDGRNYVCSGSAVTSGSKRLVATAGHCVHGGPGGTWMQNWAFVPGYDRGSRPVGTFTAHYLRTMSDWINNGETGRGFNSDVAFVTTNSNSRGRLVDVVGGHGVVIGGGYGFGVDFIGYPTNLQSGQVQQRCTGTAGSRYIGSYKFHSIRGCNFGGGSSGGPWLAAYNSSTGKGDLRTVNSFGPRGDSNSYSGAPYFRNEVGDLFKSANNDW